MKSLAKLGMAALVLPLLFCFIGCSGEDEDDGDGDKNQAQKMTFAQDGKEFSIDEDLNFEVLFTKVYTNDTIPGMPVSLAVNDKVTGTIASTNKWTDDKVNGTISEFSSTNAAVALGVGIAKGMSITVTYTKEGEEIKKAAIGFNKPAGLDDLKELSITAQLANIAQLAQLAQLAAAAAETGAGQQQAQQALVGALQQAGYLAQADASDQQKILAATTKFQNDLAEALIQAGYLAQADATDQVKITAAITAAMADLAAKLVAGEYLDTVADLQDPQKSLAALTSFQQALVTAFVTAGYFEQSEAQTKLGEAIEDVLTQAYLFELCDDIVGGTYDKK
jgi:hypothetical protein